MRKQQRDLNAGVTEDDLNEIKQDISSLRFELLEILKKNDFKMDGLKQSAGKCSVSVFVLRKLSSNESNSVKRKRGKLNLEKAMTKNIFEEANMQRISLFDTFKANQANKAKQTNDNTNNSGHKNSKKSNNSDSFTDKNKDPATLKEVHETSASGKKAFYANNQNSPSMYKIALRIKKLTEYKLKKAQSVPVAVMKDEEQNRATKAGTITATTTSETIKEANNQEVVIKEEEATNTNEKNCEYIEEVTNINENQESQISDTVEFDLGDHGIGETSSKYARFFIFLT
jgi:hypothetical protein